MTRDGAGSLSVTVAAQKSFFSLEMTPEGVSLRLDSASARTRAGTVGIFDLVLSVPWLSYPFDYTSGPRALRNHLTVLKSVTVEVRLEEAARLTAGIFGSDESMHVEKCTDATLVLSGQNEGVPFSVRAGLRGAGGGDVDVIFQYPRMFGLSDLAWSAIPQALVERLSVTPDSRVCRIPVARRVLKPLMTGLGFKLPIMDGLGLERVRVFDDRLLLGFSSGAGVSPVHEPADDDVPGFLPGPSAGSEPFDMLSRLPGASRDPAEVIAFIESAIGYPVLWPEVLARAVVIGNEHPELVSALLAAVLTGFENPGWLENPDFHLFCRRLLTAAENEGGRGELARCAVLVSRVVDRFQPPEAMALLNDIRAAGLENREVLEAVAITFDRLGRHLDASTTRLRSLAMVPGPAVADAIRAMVDRMDVNGFGAETSAWLKELSELGARGRFGAASQNVHRTAVVLLASRNAITGREGAWAMLRQVLASSPGDPEILELMLTLAREKHEVAEVIELFQGAADCVEGRARCELLLIAARAINERFGLRRRSAELLQQALAADPSCPEAASLLDTIWESLDRSAERVALAGQRLPLCATPEEKTSVLRTMLEAAESAGMYDRAAFAAKELLRLDPASVDYLAAAERVFSRSGDVDALRGVREAMEDLGVRRPARRPSGGDALEAALAVGDIDAAIECIKAGIDAAGDTSDLNEMLMQGADLSMLAGRWAEAAGFLAAAAAVEPVAAMNAAIEGCLAQGKGEEAPEQLLGAIREISARSMDAARKAGVVESLLAGAERAMDARPTVSRVFLETAMYLDPDNLSAIMALAAVYEALGMHAEAGVLAGGK